MGDWYFNECVNGFEYQVAGHMIAEGLVQEGLAVTRMVHDRYHAARRNPWNEVEYGDHYARSMVRCGVFLSASGCEHDGPRGRLGFAPRLTPENFQCAFTTAEGWGSFSQQVRGVSCMCRWSCVTVSCVFRLKYSACLPAEVATPSLLQGSGSRWLWAGSHPKVGYGCDSSRSAGWRTIRRSKSV